MASSSRNATHHFEVPLQYWYKAKLFRFCAIQIGRTLQLNNVLELPKALTNTRILVDRQLMLWPDHIGFLTKSFSERSPESLAVTEVTATQVANIVGDQFEECCAGYRWMCDAVLAEELFFRRHGRYRATSFEDVFTDIYGAPQTMKLYMDGLLLSQVFWRNHADVLCFYKKYINSLPGGTSHLEVGPGHGLLLAHAALNNNCSDITAWDISSASLSATRKCLDEMKIVRPITLEQRNIYELDGALKTYDSIVVSEVLEHLEDPVGALHGVKKILSSDGHAFINIPCNSPAPDHLFLYSKPEDFFEQLEVAGLTIRERFITPSTGSTIERALKSKLAISCAAVVSH